MNIVVCLLKTELDKINSVFTFNIIDHSNYYDKFITN